eukprot:CAMPEP_0203749704 /NCGR_PEP_ID=MMETSP0098-20131031/4161_1 /ASSEMBLY_ACC=CAM_ASM_000208 /TAXON_ID=96639 /ORGANISM=" , Strain NY0313808BC1" /LENGTH=340 /DNA_ID=CAMNT_0050638797 /DNA_START=143 /DNA_END=1165 /DNA_ORIENTATION=+
MSELGVADPSDDASKASVADLGHSVTEPEGSLADESGGESTGKGGDGLFKVEEHHDVEEVKQRLFAAPDLGSMQKEVSSIWGWVSTASASLAEKAQEAAKQAAEEAEKVAQKAKEAAEVASAAAEAQKTEFLSRMNEGGDKQGDEDVVLPWEEPESRQYADAIKGRILELSQDEKTFLIPPPEAVGFVFDYNVFAPKGRRVMEIDHALKEKRFNLVPKQIEEEVFWRNYFYRVSLIKEAYQVSNDAAAPVNKSKEEAGPRVASSGSLNSDKNKDDDNIDDDVNGWDNQDDGLDLNEKDDDENFDMLDDDELLASAGLDDESDEDDDDLEARIKNELNLEA